MEFSNVTISGLKTVLFNPKEMLRILELRSMGYYKIKQGILWQNMSKYYKFKSVNTLCEKFNRFINTLKKGRREEMHEKISMVRSKWWKKTYVREILNKYVDLDKSCLTDVEKKQVIDMLYKYKDAFSLRDEIGMCSNIKVEIAVTDKTPFFIRPYHTREEDKKILDREWKRLSYLGILKEGFSAYSSPVLLISRKVMKDKESRNRFQAFKCENS